MSVNNKENHGSVSQRLPKWMKMRSRLPKDGNYHKVKDIVSSNNLHTICTSGNCPNIGECWGNGTATFMILGEICTRSCKFCGVKTGMPLPLDPDEATRLAESISSMGIKHAVITSVDRDDLEDKGANAWAETIRTCKQKNPDLTLETLIPDFDGDTSLIDLVIDAHPEVISHNLETVRRLSPQIRSRAKYDLSLSVVKHIAASSCIAKSGIMLGIGEEFDEVLETMDDLIAVGCTVLTIGQYLQPTRDHLQIEEWVSPERFEEYRLIGIKKGFKHVEASPLVRSSYHAEKHIK